MSTKKIGEWGEKRVGKYLIRAGYKILERNWRCKAGEIDIICKKENSLIIVEVKTRLKERQRLFDSINWKKQKKLLLLAEWYKKANPEYANLNLQIDVVGILCGENFTLSEILHIESAISKSN